MVRITIHRQFQELLALCKYSHCIYAAQLKIAHQISGSRLCVRIVHPKVLGGDSTSEGPTAPCVMPCKHPTYAEKHIPGNRGTAQSRIVLMIKEKKKQHRVEVNPLRNIIMLDFLCIITYTR